MDWKELAIAGFPLVAGWILYVERRLGKIETLDAKLDLLINHLIPQDKHDQNQSRS